MDPAGLAHAFGLGLSSSDTIAMAIHWTSNDGLPLLAPPLESEAEESSVQPKSLYYLCLYRITHRPPFPLNVLSDVCHYSTINPGDTHTTSLCSIQFFSTRVTINGQVGQTN